MVHTKSAKKKTLSNSNKSRQITEILNWSPKVRISTKDNHSVKLFVKNANIPKKK